MKRPLIFIALALAASLALTPRPCLRAEQQNTKGNDELVNLVTQWLDAEARNDRTALDHLIADDFMGTAFGDNILTKDDIVPAEGGSQGRFPKSTLKQSTSRLFGDAGVVMGHITFDGQPNSDIRFTIVYVKRQAGWQMVAAHLARNTPAQP
ncbi:MAG: nuclear transport factor 2 family protein [Terriglobia bacterium]